MNRNEFFEQLCDGYCRWPRECTNQEELEAKCAACRMISTVDRLEKRSEERTARTLLPGLKIMVLTFFISAEVDLCLAFSWPRCIITVILAGVLGALEILSGRRNR